MSVTKEVIDALNQRIKDLAANSTPDQLAYLAKALESIIDKSSVSEFVQMTDEKLEELLSSTRSHLSEINSNKENSISAITEARTESISEINTLRTNSLNALEASSSSHISLLDTRKDTNIAAINSTGTEQLETLKGVVKKFETTNDVPSGSSIMKEIRKRNIIEPKSLPFLFGVLSRKNDGIDYGHETKLSDQLGQWYKDTSKTDSMLQLLAGTHTYTKNYLGFYRPPLIYNLQGSKGAFIYREYYTREGGSSDVYTYPYALLGVIFVKNTTNGNITRSFYCLGSSGWSSGYEGAGLFLGIPNGTNDNKSRISSITWTNIYNSSSAQRFDTSNSITIPAQKTAAILLYTSSFYKSTVSSFYVQFMQWGIYNFRSEFLTTGLEVDVERTLKALQCPGLDATYKIWN